MNMIDEQIELISQTSVQKPDSENVKEDGCCFVRCFTWCCAWFSCCGKRNAVPHSEEQPVEPKQYTMTPVEIGALKEGDQLAVEGACYRFVKYHHHCIFINDNEGVIHFCTNGIRRASLDEFSYNNRFNLLRVNYTHEQELSPELTVQKARYLLANPENWEPYDQWTNNCEHFASFCKIDSPVSYQSDEKQRKKARNPLKGIKYACAGCASQTYNSSK